MGGRKSATPNGRAAEAAIVVPIELIEPNPWNPNAMDEAMFEKELASIRKFGFVDPLTVREMHHPMGLDDWYEIIDGEHRWRAAKELGLTELPCWNLGVIDDDDARELTIVLNETRGQSDRERLRTLLDDLISRRGEGPIREIMPFDRARFDEIIGKMHVDWTALEERREAIQSAGRWKELVFRVPHDSARKIEDALDQVKEREGFDDTWRALEMICQDAVS